VIGAEETVKATRAYAIGRRCLPHPSRRSSAQEWRPGADAARVDAEIALAQTDLARAQQAEEVRRAQLAEALGAARERIAIVVGGLLGPVDDVRPPNAHAPTQHPLVVERRRRSIARASKKTPSRSNTAAPRSRRVALDARQRLLGSPGDGLAPDIPIGPLAAVATWAFSDWPRIRAASAAAAASEAAAASRKDETTLAVESQWRASLAS